MGLVEFSLVIVLPITTFQCMKEDVPDEDETRQGNQLNKQEPSKIEDVGSYDTDAENEQDDSNETRHLVSWLSLSWRTETRLTLVQELLQLSLR